jgi:SAM-dependent methyltransferase
MKRPTIEGFRATLDLIASHPFVADAGPDHSAWVRSGVSECTQKIRALDSLIDATGHLGRQPRLLDVGGQVGSFAEYARELGFASATVDLPVYADGYGRIVRERGVDYRACDLGTAELPFPDGAFDCVTYLDTIEHHAFSPKRILEEIRRVLAVGGRVIVTTPNHASIYNRMQLLLGRSVQDDFAYFYGSPSSTYTGHHREYTRRELRLALEGAGFRVLSCDVNDEDPRMAVAHARANARGRVRPRDLAVVAAAVGGMAFSRLSLNLGRFLFAVAEKPG